MNSFPAKAQAILPVLLLLVVCSIHVWILYKMRKLMKIAVNKVSDGLLTKCNLKAYPDEHVRELTTAWSRSVLSP